ncbi:MAG: acyl-CoA thioesterase [Chitinophagales bacterium]|nr:acyl-CoA thioesterase [Chitinophagales bacterium]
MINNAIEIKVRWADVDANRHVRHSAYYDYGAHARIFMFDLMGFDSKMMSKLNIGPVIFKEECTFLKELYLSEEITVNVLKDTNNKLDGSKWKLHHEIFNSKNQKCAHITLSGAWIDLSKRKLTTPPTALAKALHELPEGKDFVYAKKN